ncbi:zinc ribbon domain-containing protein [Saliphagus infecundisoli]|uniref:Zinc ribbon domain-containing protein n=1 Tax=Saliphagus infecundisoli TaxID=1849069 RepID=A0ABD5QI72_9EURY|nr:zinc ribbon domain-containing protein [Saliphagus infecundisoli]
MKLRYYADAQLQEFHDRILDLLEKIYEMHGIPVEVERVEERFGPLSNFPGRVTATPVENVYERDIEQNQKLRSNLDRMPSRVYKIGTRFEIAGHVSLVDESVIWISTLRGDAYGHGPRAEEATPIDFLADVAESPSNRVCLECTHLLNGSETFCPNCGHELP